MFNSIEYASINFRRKVNLNKLGITILYKSNLVLDILVGHPRCFCWADKWQHPALSINCALDNA